MPFHGISADFAVLRDLSLAHWGSWPDLDDFRRFPVPALWLHPKLVAPALQALQRSGQCGPLNVAAARCLLLAACVARCLMRAACSLLAICCTLLLPAASLAGACCVVRCWRAMRARAISLPAACSSRSVFEASLRGMTLQAWRTVLNHVIDVTVVPSQNDSSEGLANMYRDLAPAADRLRASAFSLLLLSFFFCGTLEGMFGLIAAASVLCCAAPGSLSTAYAARCTRIAAIVWCGPRARRDSHAGHALDDGAARACMRECMRMRREHARWPIPAEQHAHFA